MSSAVKIAIIIAIVASIGVFGFILFSTSDETDQINSEVNQANEQQTVNQNSDAENQNVTYTVEEVAARNTAQECWTIIDGAVFDITSYVPRHPGGDEILLACGVDGSSLFNERKTSEGEEIGSGTPHSSSATNQLNNFFIGFLEQ
jgi:cytochrome b involved in lipid metabolism